MGESRFYHIPKSGKLEQLDSVAEVMSRAKEDGFFWLYFLEPTTEDLHPLIDPFPAGEEQAGQEGDIAEGEQAALDAVQVVGVAHLVAEELLAGRGFGQEMQE